MRTPPVHVRVLVEMRIRVGRRSVHSVPKADECVLCLERYLLPPCWSCARLTLLTDTSQSVMMCQHISTAGLRDGFGVFPV